MSRQRLIQISLVAISSMLITGLAVTNVAANLPNCSNCIEAGDIATGAVNAAELDNDLDDSITANDIATGAIGSAELNNDLNNSVTSNDIGSNAIGLSELSDAITPAVGDVALEGSTSGTSADTIDSFTVDVPGSGYLYVHVSGTFYANLDATTPAAEIEFPQLAVCTASNTMLNAQCGDPGGNSGYFVGYQDPDETDDFNHTPFFSITRVISVSAGTETLYLNGDATAASGAVTLYTNVRAVALFVPGTLTLTS